MILALGSALRGARAARLLRPSSLAAGILLLSACPSLDPPIYDQEDFEGCAGACGWDVDGTGTASIVATIHPGEHGLRLEGDVRVTRVFDPPVEAGSIAWVSDGVVQLSVELAGADAGAATPVYAAQPRVDEDGDPIIEEVPGGFRPYTGTLANVYGQTTLRSLTIAHRAETAPATVDVVQVLGINTNPGCY